MNAFLVKYATGTGFSVRIPMIKAGVSDFATNSDWTPATGDVKVRKDGGTAANIATLPTYTNGRWHFVFSDAELTAKRIDVDVIDSATKAVEDQAFNIETYGHASARYVIDFEDPLIAADIWSYSGGRTLSAGAAQVVAGQQYTDRTLVRGSSYSATARSLTIVKQTGADWPSDLSDGWTWTLAADRAASNTSPGSDEITGTVSVVTATGDSQEFRISITAAVTAGLAPGQYDFSIRGTKSGEIWDAVLGRFFVLDSPHQTVLEEEE